MLPEAILSLDLGGTQLRTAVVLGDGSVLGRRSSPTPRADAETLLETSARQLSQTLDEVRSTHRNAPPPVAIAISAPGPLDPIQGVFIDPPNLDPSMRGFAFARRLGESLGLPAVMERDTQVAVMAEGAFGAARGLNNYVYITVSTGIGGGVVLDGRLLRGADGLANELGHLTIDINGPICGCGGRGHLEAISSGTGIARAMGVDRASEVAAREDAGDTKATEIMQRARDAFAVACVSIVDLYNPERIVVGGGVAIGQGDRLLQPARDAIKTTAFRRQAERVELVAAELGDDIGLIGGLSLVELAGLGDH